MHSPKASLIVVDNGFGCLARTLAGVTKARAIGRYARENIYTEYVFDDLNVYFFAFFIHLNWVMFTCHAFQQRPAIQPPS